jgi:hypothetical protein
VFVVILEVLVAAREEMPAFWNMFIFVCSLFNDVFLISQII